MPENSDKVEPRISQPSANFHWVAALVFAMVCPSVITAVYFMWLSETKSSWQQLAFGMGKAIQFAFPIVFVWFANRSKPSESAPESNPLFASIKTPDSFAPLAGNIGFRTSVWLAIGFGALVALAMIAIYGILIPDAVIDSLRIQVQQKIDSLGIDSVWKYLALGVFYTVCHSFLEEYYWRWFVFNGLRKFCSEMLANLVSGLGFAAHHVILLGFYFGWASPLTWLFAICIAVGGSFWAWLDNRSGSLKFPWLSHAIVDAAIFGLGFWMVSEKLMG